MTSKTAPNQEKSPLFFVGIGASAGGLEAVTSLLRKLPHDIGCTYVIVQHQSPTYKSMLVQLLSRETKMKVVEISGSKVPEPNTIYITPASHNVLIKHNKLKLVDLEEGVMPRPSINTFFQSLAEGYGDKAIGVVMSGTGSDGAQGLKEIKLLNGYAIAQSPETAKYSGMPQAAIDTGIVDFVLSPEAIAEQIYSIVNSTVLVTAPEPVIEPTLLRKLLIKVQQQTKIDFSGYKETTLFRRIERRMIASKVDDLKAYLAYVDNNKDELLNLSKDILISVTSFFRDKESFAKLEPVIEKIINSKNAGDEIRIWVPGCATGEEAYTVGIMLLEALAGRVHEYKVQVFATDIDLNALQHARKGVYATSAISDVGQSLLMKYFRATGEAYEVAKSLREIVVFARQDIIQDPPFLKLDLITCRNMLIYFQNHIQAKVFGLFHYALNKNGYLFLGRSESISQQENLFVSFNKDAKIFTAKNVTKRPPLIGGMTYYAALDSQSVERKQIKSVELSLNEAMSRFYIPTSIAIDSNYVIHHIHGDTSPYLKISSGRPSFDLLHLIRKEFKADLQTLVHKAFKNAAVAKGRPKKMRFDEKVNTVQLVIHPINSPDSIPIFIVAFEEVRHIQDVNATLDYDVQQNVNIKGLEDELVATREHLQTVIEELETSNEEMQALNEEVQAANEELQSSNEELESTNEELQSTNEELTTINEELQVKSTELEDVTLYLENIQNSLGFPVLVVDEQLNIVRYNRLTAQMFALPIDQPRLSLDKLILPFDMPSFKDQVARVIHSGQRENLELNVANHYYRVQIEPVADGPKTSGAVATIIDNTDLLKHAKAMRELQDRLLAIMNHSNAIISLKDLSGKYIFVNKNFKEFFKVTNEEVYEKTDRELFDKKIATKIRAADVEVLAQFGTIEKEESYKDEEGHHRYLHTVRFPLLDNDGIAYAVCTQSNEVTADRQSRKDRELASKVFEGASDGVAILDQDFKFITANSAYERITGFKVETLIGKKSLIIKDLSKTVSQNYLLEKLEQEKYWGGEIEFTKFDNSKITLWLSLSVVLDDIEGTITYIVIFNDISKYKDSQRQIEFLATHDALTNLANRHLFVAQLDAKIAVAKRNNTPFSVLFIDIDNFKIINDSLGHYAGDLVLQAIGSRLKETLRDADLIARLGGDEFAIIVDNESQKVIDVLATRIVACIAQPINVESNEVIVSASIGISTYPAHADNAAMLLKNADMAMYHAKDLGKNTYQFFETEMANKASSHLEMEADIRKAIQENQFKLVYQPQLITRDMKLCGMEALIRWHHPVKGFIPPADFIPFAEAVGLIDQISFWVFGEVFKQAYAWTLQGMAVPKISINLSPKNFRKADINSYLTSLKLQYPMPYFDFGIEFTETALLDDAIHAHTLLSVFKQHNAEISLDDFGTGYSSFVYLKKFPIDEIKIDRSFVDDVTIGKEDFEITKAIISVASSLGLTSIAEGVETEEQMQVLRKLGCDKVQGYYISKPLSPDDFFAWYKKRNLNSET